MLSCKAYIILYAAKKCWYGPAQWLLTFSINKMPSKCAAIDTILSFSVIRGSERQAAEV